MVMEREEACMSRVFENVFSLSITDRCYSFREELEGFLLNSTAATKKEIILVKYISITELAITRSSILHGSFRRGVAITIACFRRAFPLSDQAKVPLYPFKPPLTMRVF